MLDGEKRAAQSPEREGKRREAERMLERLETGAVSGGGRPRWDVMEVVVVVVVVVVGGGGDVQ